ncbi:MAG: adenine phosphoribosyltransferase [Candidatus Micrarchaeota archaeon]|nr:adenine phosphoribosyltransferase [Candidatus Micrarchaeota archaeon]
MDLKSKIRTVPDFPKKGILFYDITTLLQDPEYFGYAMSQMIDFCKDKHIDVIAAAESRGFIFGSILAHELKIPFVPVRKEGKLPYKTVKTEFETEYSKDAFEMHADAVKKGDKVLLVDDVLATGGTMKAAAGLIEKMEGEVVGMVFLIELGFLGGREKLDRYNIYSLIHCNDEEWNPEENKDEKEDFSDPEINN